MSIKLLDTLEPAGNFSIASAADISFMPASGDETSVEDKLRELDNKLNALPVLAYSDSTISYCPTAEVDFGGRIIATFKITTPAQGNCQILVERKLTFSNEPFTEVKSFNKPSGYINLDLGQVGSISDFTYRISAVDGWGRPAKYAMPDTGAEVDYLEFRYICGGVQFSSTFKENTAKAVFETGLNTLDYPFTMNYAVDSYRWLLYTVTNTPQAPIDDLSSWSCLSIAAAQVAGGLVSTDIATLTFDESTFSDTGTYYLHVCGAISHSYDLEYDSVTKSSVYTDTIELLPPSSIGLAVTRDLTGLTLTTDSFISFTFVPKTNVIEAQSYKRLYATGTVYKDGVAVQTSTLECTHADPTVWSLGRLESGTYSFGLTCYSALVTNVANVWLGTDVVIAQAEGEGTTPVIADLLFSFEADPNYFDAESGRWYNKSIGNTAEFSIQTKNLNSNLGIIDTAINDTIVPVFKLAGDAHGILYDATNTTYNPWKILTDTNYTGGFTFETYFKSKCIGELSAKVVSARPAANIEAGEQDSAKPGFSISYDTVRADTNNNKLTTPLLESVWQHVAIVVDREIRVDADDENLLVEDVNPYYTLRVYVDGVLTKAIRLTDDVFGSSVVPLVLNGYLDVADTSKVTNHGECEIRLLRCYKRGLTSSQVYQNYLNALTESDRSKVIAKNNAQITKIYFVKNKIDDTDSITEANKAYWEDKGLTNTTFDVMNKARTKAEAKPLLVNCTMHYCLGDTWGIEPNVDVSLQGTSSLEYPVKNYKIKVFEVVDGKDGKKTRKKKKILPPFKTAKDGWYTPDSVYTLKCDFMEQSHRHNTPTAAYYQDVVLDAVIKTQITDTEIPKALYSPARRVTTSASYTDEQGNTVVEPAIHKYRDSIDGFMCVVFYNENSGNDANNLGANGVYKQTQNDIYTGSYMFNVDKEGLQLGFELESEDSIVDIKIVDPITGELRYPKNTAGNDVSGLDLENIIPCVSYEGATNDNASAAAFIPWEKKCLEEAKYVYNAGYVLYNDVMDPISISSLEELLSELDKGTVIKYKNSTGDPISLRSNDEYLASFKTEAERRAAKFEYLAATLEPRFTFADEFDELDANAYNELTYSAIERAVNWVYANSDDRTAFRNEFKNYFSFEYCLAYYLQMQVFAQTDNAGKNAMFDYWYGDGKLYPRPYDMDTQMGLDNAGIDQKPASAELNLDICPAVISGSAVTAGVFGVENSTVPTWDATTSRTHSRFSAYNTSESRLWKAFGKHYSEEIADTYKKLRENGCYSVENICSYVDSMTCNVLGEKFYNKDAAIKYFSYQKINPDTGKLEHNESYVTSCLHGNRKNRYRQFLTHRLTFLDTVYSYTASQTNGVIELRTNTSDQVSSIGISVYTPQYICISVDSAKQANIIAYVDPNDSYWIDGVKYRGTKFNIPTTGTDKNVLIYGAGNIRVIHHMDTLRLSKAYVGSAVKITELDFSNANLLTELSVGNNTYLRKLILTNTPALTGSIDLRNCTNLTEFVANNSSISGVSFAKGANLKRVSLRNSVISSLSLDSLSLLTTATDMGSTGLDLTGCNSLSSIDIKTCPSLSNLPFNHLNNLTSLTISDCPGIDTVDLSGLTNLIKLDLRGDIAAVDLAGCTGEAFESLVLTALPKLSSLSLTNVSSATTTPAKVYLAAGITLSKLDLQGAKVSVLTTAAPEDAAPNTYDFNNIGFTENADLAFAKNEYVEYINGLVFCGKLSKTVAISSGESTTLGLFIDCKKLKALSNCTLTSTSTSITNLFFGCTLLREIGNISTWNLDAVTGAANACRNCGRLYYSSIKGLLDRLPNVKNLNRFLGAAKPTAEDILENSAEYPRVIPKDLFSNNTKITDLTYFFVDTDFEAIEPGLFDNLSELTTLTCTFAYMKNLVYVPKNLLLNCSKLNTLYGTFQGDTNLGKSDAVGAYSTRFNLPCIMTDTCEVLPSNNNITRLRYTFFDCKNLEIANDLHKFFEALPELVEARGVFYNCKKLYYIPNGIFKENKKLENLDAAFAQSALTMLPDTLFASSVEDNAYKTHTRLVTAMGLFANCVDMEGIVNKYFFEATPNLARIGCMGTNDAGGLHGVTIALPGMFANTKITGFHESFLTYLPNLIDASMLFFNSTRDTSGNVTNAGGAFYSYVDTSFLPDILDSEKIGSFDIYATAEGALKERVPYNDYGGRNFTNSTVVPSALFSENRQLENTYGMFSGNIYLTGVSADLFKNQKTSIKNISAMFIKCTSLEDYDGNLKTLLHNMSALEDTSHLFADCTNLAYKVSSEKHDEDIFFGCSKLAKCCGMFMNTGIFGDVPATLFNSCRSTINDVSYLFAGCKELSSIKTGTALINDPNTLTELYEQYLQQYFDRTSDLSDPPTGFNYDSFDAFREAAWAGNYTASDFTQFDMYGIRERVIAIEQPGLLSDCPELQHVHHMFSGCENLSGPIPADMFYISNSRTVNTKVKSLSGLFECCYRLTLDSVDDCNTKSSFGGYLKYKKDKDGDTYLLEHLGGGNYINVYPAIVVDQDGDPYIGSFTNAEKCCYVVPEDWLRGFTGITDISRMFYNVGAIRANSVLVTTASSSNPFTYSVLSLPDYLFSGQNSITTADWAFAFMGCTGATRLSNVFMAQSLGKLKSIRGIFCGAELGNIGSDSSSAVFSKQAKNLVLKDVGLAFYCTNTVDYSSDPDSASYCYHVDNATEVNNNGLAGSFAPLFNEQTKFSIDFTKAAGAFTATKAQPFYNYKNGNYTLNSSINGTFTASASEGIQTIYFTAANLSWNNLFTLTVLSQTFRAIV